MIVRVVKRVGRTREHGEFRLANRLVAPIGDRSVAVEPAREFGLSQMWKQQGQPIGVRRDHLASGIDQFQDVHAVGLNRCGRERAVGVFVSLKCAADVTQIILALPPPSPFSCGHEKGDEQQDGARRTRFTSSCMIDIIATRNNFRGLTVIWPQP